MCVTWHYEPITFRPVPPKSGLVGGLLTCPAAVMGRGNRLASALIFPPEPERSDIRRLGPRYPWGLSCSNACFWLGIIIVLSYHGLEEHGGDLVPVVPYDVIKSDDVGDIQTPRGYEPSGDGTCLHRLIHGTCPDGTQLRDMPSANRSGENGTDTLWVTGTRYFDYRVGGNAW